MAKTMLTCNEYVGHLAPSPSNELRPSPTESSTEWTLRLAKTNFLELRPPFLLTLYIKD